MTSIALKRTFWPIILLTTLSFGFLFQFVSPQTVKSAPVVLLSSTSLILAIASIVVVIMYLVKNKPSRLTVTAGVGVTLCLLFGILLSVWYLIDGLR